MAETFSQKIEGMCQTIFPNSFTLGTFVFLSLKALSNQDRVTRILYLYCNLWTFFNWVNFRLRKFTIKGHH